MMVVRFIQSFKKRVRCQALLRIQHWTDRQQSCSHGACILMGDRGQGQRGCGQVGNETWGAIRAIKKNLTGRGQRVMRDAVLDTRDPSEERTLAQRPRCRQGWACGRWKRTGCESSARHRKEHSSALLHPLPSPRHAWKALLHTYTVYASFDAHRDKKLEALVEEPK